MADTQNDFISIARQRGYSDAEIADRLGVELGVDLKPFRDKGYSDTDLATHLAEMATGEKHAAAPAKEDDSGDFVRGAEVALKQTPAIAKGFIGAIGATGEKVFGEGGASTAVKDWGLKGYKEGMDAVAPLQHETDSASAAWEKAKAGDLGALVDWAQYGLGYGAGQIGETAITALIGAAAGSAIGPEGTVGGAVSGIAAKTGVKALAKNWIEKQVAEETARLVAKGTAADAAKIAATKTVANNIAKKVGAGAALQGYNEMQEVGSIYPDAVEQNGGETLSGGELAKVWGYGTLAAAVESGTDLLGLDALTGKIKIPGGGGRAMRAATGATIGATGEAGTEAVQTMLERAGAGQDVFSDEGIRDIVDSAAMGALPGGVVGGVAGALHHAPKPAATVADVAAATSVPEAIAAAESAVSSSTVDSLAPAIDAFKNIGAQNPTGLIWTPQAPAAPGASGDLITDTTPAATPSTEPIITTRAPSPSEIEQYQAVLAKKQRGELLSSYEQAIVNAGDPMTQGSPVIETAPASRPFTPDLQNTAQKSRNAINEQAAPGDAAQTEIANTGGQMSEARPTTIAGVPAASHTEEQLRQMGSNVSVPMSTRRAAMAELQARQNERQRAPNTSTNSTVEDIFGEDTQQREAGDNDVRGERVTRAMRLFLTQAARLTGTEVVFGFNPKSADGSTGFERDGNTVFVNTAARINPMAVLGHEVTHVLKTKHREGWDQIKNALVATLGTGAEKRAALDSFAENYLSTKKARLKALRAIPDWSAPLTPKQHKAIGAHSTHRTAEDFLLDEMTSDLGGNHWTSEKFWADVFARIEAAHGRQEAKGIIQRLMAALKDSLQKFMALARQSGFGPGFQTIRADQLEATREAAAKAYAEWIQMERSGEPKGYEAERAKLESMRANKGQGTVQNEQGAVQAAAPVQDAQPSTEREQAEDANTVEDLLGERARELEGLQQSPRREHEDEVSPRRPTGKARTEDPISQLLQIDYDAIRRNPEGLKNQTGLVETYPNYRPADSAKTPEQKAERFIQHLKSNLLWLYAQVPQDIRDRAHLWYDGANKIAGRWSKEYKLKDSQIAGVMAVLSPQKDWYTNVSLAKRVLDIWTNEQGTAWSREMGVTAERIFAKEQYQNDLAEIRGRPLSALDGLLHQAMWLRVFDETHNSRHFPIITPEGETAGLQRNFPSKATPEGAYSTAAWGSLNSIAKAISVIQNGSLKNIDEQLGNEHKVRSFFNNILVPNSKAGHVTIDTHAVAAALLRPLSGNSREVAHNFGGNIKGEPGPGSNSLLGYSGTYGLYAEAYRQASKEAGILPREMQSITWEAVRGLFERENKKTMDFDHIWHDFKKGKVSLENTRQRILEAGGGINAPSWFGRSAGQDAARQTAADKSDVAGAELPGRGAEPTPGGARSPNSTRAGVKQSPARVLFEVAPDPNDKDLAARWNALSDREKQRISRAVAAEVMPEVFTTAGVTARMEAQLGGYLDDTNPSFAAIVEDGASAQQLIDTAKMAGFALSQDSMMVISNEHFDGSFETGLITITFPSVPEISEVRHVYAMLRKLDSELVQGHTTVGREMVLAVESGKQLDLALRINEALGDAYAIDESVGHMAFPEKKEYDYDHARKGSELFAQRSNANRARATAQRALARELDAVQGRRDAGPQFSLARATSEIIEYANAHPTEFYRTPATNAKGMQEIGQAIDAKLPIREVSTATPQDNGTSLDFTPPDARYMYPDKMWSVTLEGDTDAGAHFFRNAYIVQKGDAVWVNVGGLAPGDGGGKVYMIAGAYARNNGLKLIGDPGGITEAGKRRRLENMIALAMKYGTTRFMAPHDNMLNGWQGLKWLPNLDNNLPFLMKASTNVVESLYPEIKNVEFNRATASFERDGQRIGRADFERMAEDLRSRLSATDRAGAPGSGTLRLAVLYRSLSKGDNQPRLAELSREDSERAQSLRADLRELRFSEQRAPVFYSQLARAGDQLPAKVTTAKEVSVWLQSNAAKLGVKKDEIQWTGITDWLDAQGKAKVTRAQIAEFLEQGGVKVEETMLSNKGFDEDNPQLPSDGSLSVEFANDIEARYNYEVVDTSTGRVRGYGDTKEDALFDAYSGHPEYWSKGGATQYAKYQLPGGENYKELLLTLPVSKKKTIRSLVGEANWLRMSESKRQELLDSDVYEPEAKDQFRSSHFDQPNILAHVRMNERTDAEGRRVLFIEEVQSDWGQKGKKEGFAADFNTLPGDFFTEPAPAHLADKFKFVARRRTEPAVVYGAGDTEAKALEQGHAAWRELEPASRSIGIPTAPFVTDTKSWTALALKRVLRYAADNGFDAIAWTTGEQQAERYDLRKYVDYIEYEQTDPGKYYIRATDSRGGRPLTEYQQTLSDIEEKLGKDVANAVQRNEGEHQPGEPAAYRLLRTKDLKVGGDGMKGYYDGILPQVANDVLKKVGGGKVGSITLSDNSFTTKQGAADDALLENLGAEVKGTRPATQPGIVLTPEMKETVQQGLPMFSEQRDEDTESVQEAWDRYDDEGTSTMGDLVGELEFMVEDGLPDSDDIAEAVRAYRKDEEYDRELGGRNDMDSADAKVEDAVRRYLSRPQQSPPRSTITGQQVQSTWTSPEIEGWQDGVIRAMQDKLVDTKAVVKAIRDMGVAIKDKFDPYLQETQFHGRAGKAVSDFADGELYPLLQDMRARDVTMQELEDYLLARHAVERNAQIARINPGMPDGGSGITNQQAADILSGRAVQVGPAGQQRTAQIDPARMKAYQALAAKVDAITKGTTDLLVSSGLETQATVDAWRSTYAHYVPLMRDMEADDNYNGAFGLGLGTGQGFNVRGAASKRAMGSERLVIDVLANVAMQRERAIVRAEKNRVSQAVYGLALTAPNPEFWAPINPDLNKKLTPQALNDAVQELVGLGMNPIDAENLMREPVQTYIDPNTGLVMQRINAQLRGRDDVLATRINGQDRYVFFSSDARAQQMVRNLKNLDTEQLNVVMGAVAQGTRYFAAINTQFNPVFGLANGIRDLGTAALNLESTPLKGMQKQVLADAFSALRGIYIDLRDHRNGTAPTSQWAQLYEEFAKEGGQTGYRDSFRTSKARADAIAKELKNAGKGMRWLAVGEKHSHIFGWLSDFNTSIENAVRLSAYKAGKDRGMSNAQAASLAKNLTVNFNKKGNAATQVGALYAFFNASVQSTARIAQTMVQKGANGRPELTAAGKKILYGGMVLGVLQAVLGAMAGWDDDEPPQFAREKNFMIPLPGGHYLSIPYPLGFHVIPNIGRIGAEYALSGFKNPGKRLTNLAGLLVDGFNPIGNGDAAQLIAPTIADPFVSLAENKDWTGKEIARQDFNSMEPTAGWTRTKDSASALSKQLAYGINYITGGGKYEIGTLSPTPDQLDYLIGQATGGVGRETLKGYEFGKAVVTGEDIPTYKIPVAGRFVGDTTGQASETSKFYNNLRRIGEHKSALTEMKDDHNGDAYAKYLEKHPDARLVQTAEKAQRELGYLKRQKRDALEKGASKEQVRLIEDRITGLVKRYNAVLKEKD